MSEMEGESGFKQLVLCCVKLTETSFFGVRGYKFQTHKDHIYIYNISKHILMYYKLPPSTKYLHS